MSHQCVTCQRPLLFFDEIDQGECLLCYRRAMRRFVDLMTLGRIGQR
jgi:hypothetical protein